MLDVGAGNLVYWETRGNPTGKPALIVQVGPGPAAKGAPAVRSTRTATALVLFDQRVCLGLGQQTGSKSAKRRGSTMGR
jgi:proline iminopeptidase